VAPLDAVALVVTRLPAPAYSVERDAPSLPAVGESGADVGPGCEASVSSVDVDPPSDEAAGGVGEVVGVKGSTSMSHAIIPFSLKLCRATSWYLFNTAVSVTLYIPLLLTRLPMRALDLKLRPPGTVAGVVAASDLL
jgi:hypothetical protein